MKRVLIWLALAGTLAAAYFAPQEEEAVVVAPARVSKHPVQTVAMTTATGRQSESQAFDMQIRPRTSDEDLGNAFASHSWTPPPPPPTAIEKAAPPPPPEAPLLPFRFLGRMVEDGKTVYFLQFNDRNLVMRVGDTVDNTYTLEGSSSGTLTFAYLPLNKKQTLAVGEVD